MDGILVLKVASYAQNWNIVFTLFNFYISLYSHSWHGICSGMHVGDKRRLIIPPSMGLALNLYQVTNIEIHLYSSVLRIYLFLIFINTVQFWRACSRRKCSSKLMACLWCWIGWCLQMTSPFRTSLLYSWKLNLELRLYLSLWPPMRSASWIHVIILALYINLNLQSRCFFLYYNFSSIKMVLLTFILGEIYSCSISYLFT